jgi:hypothetical protein
VPDEANPDVRASHGFRRRRKSESSAPVLHDTIAELERAEEARKHFLSSLPILTSIAVFLFAVLKIMLVARGDPSTALAIVSSSGPLQVVAGVLIVVVPLATASVVTLSIFLAGAEDISRQTRSFLWLAYFILVVGLSEVLYWFSTLEFILVPFAFVALRRWEKKILGNKANQQSWLDSVPSDSVLNDLWLQYHELQATPISEMSNTRRGLDLSVLTERSSQQSVIIETGNARIKLISAKSRRPYEAIAITLLLTTLLPLVPSTLNDTPWLPPERITTPHQTVIGYVTDSDQQWTTVLVDSSRAVLWINTATITARVLCTLGSDSALPAPETIYRFLGAGYSPPHYPTCRLPSHATKKH